jgi:hypothetical protein
MVLGMFSVIEFEHWARAAAGWRATANTAKTAQETLMFFMMSSLEKRVNPEHKANDAGIRRRLCGVRRLPCADA